MTANDPAESPLEDALRREARADAARPVPPLVQRALSALPARAPRREAVSLTVLPGRRARPALGRVAAGLLVGLGLLGAALAWTASGTPDATTPATIVAAADETAEAPAAALPTTAARAVDTWQPAIVALAPRATPAEQARRQGPPAMLRRLFHPRLPALPAPAADVQSVATGAGVRVEAHVRSLLSRLFWPLRQALTPRE